MDFVSLSIVVCVILCLHYLISQSGYSDFDGLFSHFYYVRTDTENTPYVRIDDHFYSKPDCEKLYSDIKNSRLVVSNPLNGSFKNTKGFLIQFIDYPHLEQRFQKHGASFAYNVFRKIKNPKCNAFICNLLVIPARNKKQSPEIGMHQDCTLDITEESFPYRTYLPKCVSVLYIQTPVIFSKGELELYTFMGLSDIPEQVITPKIGRLVEFRGDLFHSVNSFESDEDTPRVSLVFEQYILPSHLLPTKKFELLSEKY